MSAFAIQRFLALASVCALAACASQTAALPSQQSPAESFAIPATGKPPACKGQSKTSLYATSRQQTLSNKGGFLCIPAFGGFGGAIDYPAASPAVSVTLTSSTTNYNSMLPVLAKGKPVFYLQLATSAATDFGKPTAVGKGLESKSIVAGTSYDVYGQAKLGGVAGIMVTFTPCKSKAVTGRYGGTIEGLGAPMSSQNLGGPATITLEIYPASAKVKSPC